MITTLLSWTTAVLRTYLPLFFTYQYVRSKDNAKIERILKFWCINVLAFLVQWPLQLVLSANVSPLLFVALFVVLNLKEYQYAETIYDMTIMPLFLRYKLVLQQSASQLEEAISQQTNKLHKGVQESFQQKLARFGNNLLYNALNPTANQKNE